jgi:hypothetical protein
MTGHPAVKSSGKPDWRQIDRGPKHPGIAPTQPVREDIGHPGQEDVSRVLSGLSTEFGGSRIDEVP